MIKYIGVNDYQIDLFEGQYKVQNGMSYNSYLIKDKYNAVMDTVDIHFSSDWLNNIKNNLAGEELDYLVILHMEPDHSASLEQLVNTYPNVKIVGNTKTFMMIKQFFPNLEIKNEIAVKDNDTLELGNHILKFIFAPMIHWPEVMMAYDMTTKVLFSADAFGKFGALDREEAWIDEARRYYIGIVGKYGIPVQNLLKKASSLEIKEILPLHGPILKRNLGYYLDLYNKWSSYEPEENGVCIVYASIYGNTKKGVEKLITHLDTKYEVFDLARCDIAEAISKAFKYSRLVIAAPTYNNGVFPPVEAFLHGLVERDYQKRYIGVIENGSWAPAAKRYIENYFSNSKNIYFLENNVTIKSALNEEAIAKIALLAEELNN